MKTFLQTFGAILVGLGLMAAAGAAGDCDGACGPGNSLPVMLSIIGGSLVAMMLGAYVIFLGTEK
jgi:hypothetical protein